MGGLCPALSALGPPHRRAAGLAQLCQVNGEPYRCGQRAALASSDLLGSRTVHCAQTDVYPWGRSLAECSVERQDPGAWMVEQGWAIAYRQYSGGTDPLSSDNEE